MTTLHPFGTTITDATLRQIFAPLNQWEDKYRQLILLGKKLPTLTDERKAQAHEIAGCENRVWLGYEEDAEGRLHFFGDSEGRIVRGLLAVLLTAVEGKTRAGILAQDPLALFDELGLRGQLSASRKPGPQRPERGGARRRPRKVISRFRFPAAAPGGQTTFRKPQRHAALSPASSSGHATPRRTRRSRSPSSPRQSRKRSPSASALPAVLFIAQTLPSACG
ncbi:cysteine desulfuration protein CsdE [Klebsiella pneumoniae]|uniref:Cysteine desulfuration protein CsdE n=22 Tax=Enterobacteriaceae TaxID=543 RepID=A0A3S4GXX9_KLEPN|nr:cysteine desulfuration protein CsdE [Klebsiella pneumoniae]